MSPEPTDVQPVSRAIRLRLRRLIPVLRWRLLWRESQAIEMFGRANTRMKDDYDIRMLSQTHAFRGDGLADAMAATFARRATDIPTARSEGLSEAFAKDVAKMRQWQSFTANIETARLDLTAGIEEFAAFRMPHAEAARRTRS